jgi:RecA/RadA recombinase
MFAHKIYSESSLTALKITASVRLDVKNQRLKAKFAVSETHPNQVAKLFKAMNSTQ